MTMATILFVDNTPKFLKVRSEFLEAEGYYVIPAADAATARKHIEQGGIDLAILDIRLNDDEDEKDFSGLTLAKEISNTLPKIILTNYPTVDAVRMALKPHLDGLSIATEFVYKNDGAEVLIQTIKSVLGKDSFSNRKVMRKSEENK